MLKVVLGILLFIMPLGLSTLNSIETSYAMTPIGVAAFDDDGMHLKPSSFKWFSATGRNEYIEETFSENPLNIYHPEYYAIMWIMDTETDDPHSFVSMWVWMGIEIGLSKATDISTSGTITLVTPFLIILYLVLCIVSGGITSLIADVILLGSCILSVVAFFSFTNIFGANYDSNIPIYAIYSLILTIVGFLISKKELEKDKKKKRRRR